MTASLLAFAAGGILGSYVGATIWALLTVGRDRHYHYTPQPPQGFNPEPFRTGSRVP